MSYSLGVDLGTTFTAAAMAVVSTARSGLGNRALEIPSVLFLGVDGFVVRQLTRVVEPARWYVSASAGSATTFRYWSVVGRSCPAPHRPVLICGDDPEASERRRVSRAHPPRELGALQDGVLLGQVATLADVTDVRWVPEPVAAAAQYPGHGPGSRLGRQACAIKTQAAAPSTSAWWRRQPRGF